MKTKSGVKAFTGGGVMMTLIIVHPIDLQFLPTVIFDVYVGGITAFHTYSYLQWVILLSAIIGLCSFLAGTGYSKEAVNEWKAERGFMKG